MTNDLENKLIELEKLCDEFTLRIHTSPASLDIRQAYGAAMLTIEQMPKLIKALRVAIAQRNSWMQNDNVVENHEFEDTKRYNNEVIQQIICGGGDV